MSDRMVDHKHEIHGVFYLAAALLLAVVYYVPASQTGWIGQILLSAGRGLLGSTAFALPAVLLYMALDYLLEQQLRITRQRFNCVLILLLLATGMIALLTLDLEPFREMCLDKNGQLSAWISLQQLWQIGKIPGLIGSGNIWSGGLLGGLIALGLQALAGWIGAVIICSALILAMLVLIFNLSVSQAVHKTAQAIAQTGGKMDSAVRRQVDLIRDATYDRSTPVIAGKSNYDLPLATQDLSNEPIGEEDIWGNADQVAESSAVRSSRDPFAQMEGGFDTILDAHDAGSGYRSTPADAAKAANKEGVLFDFSTSSPGSHQSDPAAGLAGENDQNLPAWLLNQQAAEIRPIDVTQINQADQNISDTMSGQPVVIKPDSAHPQHTDGAVGPAQAEPAGNDHSGRAHWADRTDEVAAATLPSGRTMKFNGPPGSQLPILTVYEAPPLTLLKEDQQQMKSQMNTGPIKALGFKLEQTLKSFGVEARVVHFTTGPTITRFELTPGPGVKVSKIVNLADDIALNLAAMGVRIEAPIPGKSAIGIEIPNKETTPVLLRGLMDSPEFSQSRGPLTAALGRDVQGLPILCDLAKMPHLLIAGATGSGKSVCINAILMSILFKSSPDDVRLLMIDPKVVELSVYNGIPHLLQPVVTDPKKAYGVLNWAVAEMTRRYGLFAERAVRDIHSYNDTLLLDDDAESERLPLILLVIDELSDLMATTPNEVEDAIARLTAMARAAGIHLIIATQRPSVDVITGVIKANIPSRIAFAVASQIDSRTILDMGGAEKLLGKGDMLYYPQSAAKPIRGQGAFITDAEVERVLTHIKSLYSTNYDDKVAEAIQSVPGKNSLDHNSGDQDELLPQALGIVVEAGYASVSLLQRRMTVGYPRAARLIDRMHEMGYIGPFEGSKPRKVLLSMPQYLDMQTKEEGKS